MEIRPIHNERDYKRALKVVSGLVDTDPAHGTPDGDYLEVLVALIERYETEHFPHDLPDPIEAIKFRMEQLGLKASDLQPYIGNQGRVYEVLNRKRGLSIAMIRRLSRELKIPAEVLLG